MIVKTLATGDDFNVFFDVRYVFVSNVTKTSVWSRLVSQLFYRFNICSTNVRLASLTKQTLDQKDPVTQCQFAYLNLRLN